jgi:hypothetical protein
MANVAPLHGEGHWPGALARRHSYVSAKGPPRGHNDNVTAGPHDMVQKSMHNHSRNNVTPTSYFSHRRTVFFP